METQVEETKIEQFETGFVITITDKNWVKTGNFVTPCFIELKQDIFVLTNNSIVNKQTGHKITGDDFNWFLPNLLKNGKMLLSL